MTEICCSIWLDWIGSNQFGKNGKRFPFNNHLLTQTLSIALHFVHTSLMIINLKMILPLRTIDQPYAKHLSQITQMRYMSE